jgi:hypothetical protein
VPAGVGEELQAYPLVVRGAQAGELAAGGLSAVEKVRGRRPSASHSASPSGELAAHEEGERVRSHGRACRRVRGRRSTVCRRLPLAAHRHRR